MTRPIPFTSWLLVTVFVLVGIVSYAQNPVPLTNEDIVSLKKAGIGDDVIILTINRGVSRFRTQPADLVTLKNAGVSDAVISAMLKSASDPANSATSKSVTVDSTNAALVLQFDSSVTDANAVGLPEATRAAVIQALKNSKMFTAYLAPEEADGIKTSVQISGRLVDFASGNVATRMVIGLGTGRAHAGFIFTIKDPSGEVIWTKTIKETASFWSNSASSSAQRSELPEKVAKTLVEELQKAKVPALKK